MTSPIGRLTPLLLCLPMATLPSCGIFHKKPPAARRPDAPFIEKDERAAVIRTLDALHDTASKAEGDRYFSLFASDAVFLGTDASERWTIQQFQDYARPLFAAGKGWTYRPLERHVQVSPDGWAFFDELLENAKYGTCRGSGVLRQYATGAWLIEQYDLSVPIPNAMLPDVAEQIRQHAPKQAVPPTPPVPGTAPTPPTPPAATTATPPAPPK